MIPLSALPLRFVRGRALPRFMRLRDREKISRVIALYESVVNSPVPRDVLQGMLEELFENFKVAKAVFYAMSYFYEFSKPLTLPSEADEWSLKRRFYEWVAERYGFLRPDEREDALREFASKVGLPVEKLKAVLEADLSENQLLRRKRGTPSPADVIGVYNFLVLEKLLSISEEVELTYFGPRRGELAKKLILMAKRHDVIAEFVSSNSRLVIKVTGPHQIFKLPAVSEYGRHIAAVISPIIVNYEEWRLYGKIVYRKRKAYFVVDGYSESSPPLKPYWSLDESQRPRETYDSSVEERIARLLEASLSDKGIRVLREADVIVLRSGKIVIPDFTISFRGRKVLLEVVGYWRDKYIESKRAKLREMAEEGYRVIAIADSKLRGKLAGVRVPVFYYDGAYIPFGKIYKEILRLLNT